MSEDWYHCAGCGRFLPASEIGITGRCSECWQKWLEEHDTRMQTIAWRERMRRDGLEAEQANKEVDQR